MILRIGRAITIVVADNPEASRAYAKRRDASNLGARDFPEGTVWDGQRYVARVTYNARVWSIPTMRGKPTLLHDPATERAPLL